MKFLLVSSLLLSSFGQSPKGVSPKCFARVVLPPAKSFGADECLVRAQIRELQLMTDLVDLSKGCPVDVKLADKESEVFQADLEKCKKAAIEKLK